ncbi:PKD-like domain-containing protein [Pontibacter locisalis]|uniref:PKD-like domain-containing protein n=1 Tax=Pontibacter locisalis TaxID=1719035 RepID=A0ABW5IKY8_9BACT
MKKKFTHLVAEASEAKQYIIGVLLLLFLLLIAQVAGAQTITSVNPVCATVGEGVALTINGSDFTVGTVATGGNKGEGNVNVVIKDNAGGTRYNAILQAFSASIINVALPASVFTSAGTYTIQVANRDNTGNGFFSPTPPYPFEVYPKLTIGQPAGSTSVCASSTNNYSISVAGAKNYEWTVVSGSATIVSGASSGTAQVSFGSAAGTVRLGVRAFNQCDFPTAVRTIDVTVNPRPVLSSSLTPAAICSGTAFSYTAASATPGATFSWSRTAVAGITGSTSGSGSSGSINETLTNSTANPIDVTYVVTASANGCVGPPQNVTVRVNPSPGLSSPVTATVCSGTPFTYTATSATPGTTFSWSRAAAVGVSNPANNGNSASISETLVNTTSSPVQVTFNVTMVANGCSTTQPVTVTVNPSPELSSPATATVCSGQPFTYTATSATAGTSFSWSRAAVAGITSTTNSGSSASINETLYNSTPNPVVVTYSITMSANGCSNTQEVKVTVNPKPALTSTTSPADICDGATFSYTPTSATAGATFTWTRQPDSYGNTTGASDTGSINEVLNNTTSETQTINYVIRITANGCPDVIQQVKVKVHPKPKLTSSLTATVCSSQPFNYTPTSIPSGATFSWSRAAVTGISNAAASGNGAVNEMLINTTEDPLQVTYIITSTASGCSLTEQVVVTVKPQPSAVITPSGPTDFCQAGGNSVTLDAPAGNGYTYEWFLNGGTTAVSTERSITVTEPGTYSYVVRVTDGNNGCPTTSSPMQVKVVALDANIANITYTGSTNLCEGESITLQALENSTYAYQWSDENGIIPGATSAKYVTKEAGRYWVTIRTTVDGTNCEKTSDPITINVTPAVTNTLSSGDTEICSGGTAPQINGNPATGGSGTYTYLWESSTSSSSSGFTAASGINNGVNYDPGTPTQTTWYRRSVISGACAVFSDPVRVTVTPVIANNTLTITNQTICANQSAPTLTGRIPTGGNNTYAYQWEMSTDGGTNFTEIGGATAQNYSPGALTATTIFRRIAISGACEIPSGTVTITVTQLITNYNITTDQSICSGSIPAALTGAPAGGNGNFAYQWERSTDGTTFTAISGATAQDYTPGSLTADTWYRRKVSSGNCSENSNAVKITVTPPVGNTISTATIRTCAGEAVPEITANAATGGNSSYTYTWESSSDGISFTAITETNTPTYSPGNLTETTWFRRKVESGACTSYSATVKVEVTPVIVGNSISNSDFSVCYDTYPGQLTGSVLTGGSGNITYRWEYSTTSGTEGFSRTGYDWLQNHSPGSLKQTTWYRRVAISGSCESISNIVKITVTPLVTDHLLSGTQVYCHNATASPLTGSFAGGEGPATALYQWQQSASASGPWENIEGATGAEYTPSTSAVGKMYYRRLVNSGGCTDKASNAYAVTVNPIPAVNTVSNLVYCSGISAPGISFSSNVNGTNYTWKSDVNVGFGLSGTGNIPVFITSNTGTSAVTATVTVTPTANGCEGNPITFTVTINPKPTVTVSLSRASVCAGETTTVSATPSGGTGNYTYAWTVPSGATDPGNVASFTASVAGTYRVVVTDGKSCSSASASATLTVNPLPTASISGVNDNQVIYSGQSNITLTGSPSGGTWSWPGRTNSSGNSFSPCAAFSEAIKTAPSGATEVNVTISYTVTANGCTNTVTKTVKIRKSKYNVVAFSNIKPFCRGDNVTHTVQVYRDATVIYPYLANEAGDPIKPDPNNPGSFVSVGINELPVPNPDYPYPAGTTDIEKHLSYRFFQPIVTGGVLLPDNQFTYQWTKNQKTEQGNRGVTYSNAGLSSLEYYAAFVSGNLACGESFNSKLSYRVYGAVLEDYAISIAVSSNPICPGDPTTFTATLDSDFSWSIANLTMVWKLRRNGVVYNIKTVQGTGPLDLTSTEIEAALAAQGVSPATLIDGDEVFIDFTSDLAEAFTGSKCDGNASSNPITIRVNDLIESTPTLQNPIVCVGSTVTFTAPVTPTGTAQVTYTWTVGSGNDIRTYTTTTNQLTIVADGSFTPDVAYPVSVVVTNGCVTTQAIALGSLTVNTPPSISVQPVPVRVCEGTRTEFSVTAAGSGITYQWLKDGQPIEGATSSTYVIESPVETDEGTYSVQIIGTSACGNLTSNGAVLTVDQPATITTNLPTATQSLCVGGTATFSVSATGTGLQFVWYKVGMSTPIANSAPFNIGSTVTAGITTSTLTITGVEIGHAGQYYAQVSNDTQSTACTASPLSEQAVLEVNPNPLAEAEHTPVCIGSPATVSANVTSGTAPFTYTWTVPAGATNPGNVASFQTTVPGEYTVTVSDAKSCGSTSATTNVQFTQPTPVEEPVLVVESVVYMKEWKVTAVESAADPLVEFGDDPEFRWYRRVSPDTNWGSPLINPATNQPYSTDTYIETNPVAGLEIKAEILNSASCTLYSLTNIGVVPLPVEIIYLTAEKQESDVVLKWATAMERDNTGFEVQVSNNGLDYRKITFVPTRNGNTTTKQLYEYTDKENGKHGTRYYRLKQIDHAGTFEYFGPKVVEFGSVSNKLLVYPNPFKDEVEVSIDAEQDGEVEIVFTNSVGRQLIKTTVQVKKGLNVERLLLGTALPRGVYFVTTRMGSVTNHFKLLKQ